jgi:thioredoxin reductase
MMTRTVDVIVIGGGRAAVAAALEQARRRMRVMVVVRSRQSSRTRGIRRAIHADIQGHKQIQLVTGAEVACIDGVNAVEAVVIRDLRTGRLTGVNASQVLYFEGR